jgi:hypothetical protein
MGPPGSPTETRQTWPALVEAAEALQPRFARCSWPQDSWELAPVKLGFFVQQREVRSRHEPDRYAVL